MSSKQDDEKKIEINYDIEYEKKLNEAGMVLVRQRKPVKMYAKKQALPKRKKLDTKKKIAILVIEIEKLQRKIAEKKLRIKKLKALDK